MQVTDTGGSGRRSLRDRLAGEEEAVFVGRTDELSQVDAVLDGRDERVVVFLHGPGGIGKTTLLHRLVRRAERLGWATAVHDARDLADREPAAAALLDWAAQQDRAMVAIDTWEGSGAGVLFLRDDVLSQLPEDTVIILAGRGEPDPDWWGPSWTRLTLALGLVPLDPHDSLRLLALHGINDTHRASDLAGWAAGSPLALVMAAAAGPEWDPSDDTSTLPLVTRLSARIVDGGVPEERLGALAVAAVARVVTPTVLAAALPGSDAADAYGWLEERSYAEPFAGGIRLHSLVAGVVRSEATQRHPDLMRDVRRRVADHFWARALRAGSPTVPDLLHLIQDPEVRWGIGWDEDAHYRVDRVRPGDIDVLATYWTTWGETEQWVWVRRYLEEAPEVVGVARNRAGLVRGVMISTSARSAPPLCLSDPDFGPWIEHARAADPDGNAVLWRLTNDLTGRADYPVQSLLGAAGIRRSGLANPRRVYLPINPKAPHAVAFAAAVGAERVPELTMTVGTEPIECHLADLGPGGVIGAYRDMVYREVGLVPPTPEPAPGLAVRDVLRSWDDPVALAASPLAEGTTVVERAESVRRLVRTAVETAFGAGRGDAFTRTIIEEGYLDRSSSHEATARRLGLSRASYFRRLREGAERVAACLPT